MREQNIQVSPFPFISIYGYDGLLKMCEHGRVTVKGIIQTEKEAECLQWVSERKWTEIWIKDADGANQLLFCGIAAEAHLKVNNGVKELTLTILTGSSLMDEKEHLRSFENSHMKFGEVASCIVHEYEDGSVIVNPACYTSIGQYFCQYEETDWQFLKRIASCCSAVLLPNYRNKGVKFFLGVPKQATNQTVESNEYLLKRTNGKSYYVIKSREIYRLGEELNFQGKRLVVAQIKSTLEGSELYHSYDLMEDKDLSRQKQYNDNLTGVSLSATVQNVRTDQVQLKIAGNEYKGGSRWFTFATIYSSPDGTGWYCMPEIGDCVRLYFPTRNEDDAFVMSAVHLQSEDSSERVNPAHKSIMNKYGKEILLTPTSLILTNNAGMSVELSDERGIIITSDKAIEIQSEEAVTLSSVYGKIDLSAQEAVVLQQGTTRMVLSEKVMMQGARVKLD